MNIRNNRCNYCSSTPIQPGECIVCGLDDFCKLDMVQITRKGQECWIHRRCKKAVISKDNKIYSRIITSDSSIECHICRRKSGNLIRCSAKSCNTFSHVICSQIILSYSQADHIYVTTLNNLDSPMQMAY